MAIAARSNEDIPATKARAINVLQLQEGLNNLGTKSIYIGLGDKDGLEICVPGTNGYHRTDVRISDFWGAQNHHLPGFQRELKEALDYEILMPKEGHPYFPRMLLAYTNHRPDAELLDQAFLQNQDAKTTAEQDVVINILGGWVENMLRKKLKQAWDASYFDVYDTRK